MAATAAAASAAVTIRVVSPDDVSKAPELVSSAEKTNGASASAASAGGGLTKSQILWVIASLAVVTGIGLAIGLSYNSTRSSSRERTVFLAVEEDVWDYAPTRTAGLDNPCTGAPYGEADDVFVAGEAQGHAGLIGSQYHVRRFFAYPDASFAPAKRMDTPPEWEHAQLFGPALRVAVGDTLRVRLRNRSRYPASFHAPAGVSLASFTLFHGDREKDGPVGADTLGLVFTSTRAEEPDGHSHSQEEEEEDHATAVLADPFVGGWRSFDVECRGPAKACADTALPTSTTLYVPPGGEAEFVYTVGESSGPSEGQGQTVARLYRSRSYSQAPAELSLAGLLIVSRSGRRAAAPSDVSAEFLTLPAVADENSSPYLALNVLDFVLRARSRHAGTPAAAPGSAVIPIDGLEGTPGVLLAALFNAVKPASAAAATAAAVAALFPSSSTTVRVDSSAGVHLGLIFNLTARTLDATAFAAHYGQRVLEDAAAPALLEAFQSAPDFDAGTFEESNLMHSVNGYLYCNTPGVRIAELGSHARFYVAVLGGDVDMHTAHWHGNVLEIVGRHVDSQQLLPGQVLTLDMIAENAGAFLHHCHVTDHIGAGMSYIYAVEGGGAGAESGGGHSEDAHDHRRQLAGSSSSPTPPAIIAGEISGRVRDYFIAAELVQWDYTSPGGLEACRQMAGGGFASPASVTVEDVAPINTTFAKVLYVQYTDATFTTKVERGVETEHLGMLGPLLRAEVGDTLRVHFLNRSPRAFSVHPHGVFYAKSSEGAPYADGTAGADKGDDEVAPGQSWTYTWFVPYSAGPGPADPSSVPWLIHGHFHETADEHAGTIAVLVVTRRGAARDAAAGDLIPTDVDREFVLLYKAFDEAATALEEHTGHGSHHRRAEAAEEADTNLYALNGKIMCGLEGLHMIAGERVRWHVVSLGNEVDVHSAVFTGSSVVWQGRRVSGVPLLAGTMHAVDMVPERPGSWVVTDGSSTFSQRGLAALYHVHAYANPPPIPTRLTRAPSFATPTRTPARSYFLAAEQRTWAYAAAEDECIHWNQAPAELLADFDPRLEESEAVDAAGRNLNFFPASGRKYLLRDDTHLGAEYVKARFRAYSSAAFSNALPEDPAVGLLGPTLRIAVGETIEVTLRNSLSFPVNVDVPHGLTLLSIQRRAGSSWSSVFDAASPPTFVPPATAPLARAYAVPPGETVRYLLHASAAAAPGPDDPDSIAFLYSSGVEASHVHAGLLGAVIVYRTAAALQAAATQAPGAPVELVAVMVAFDENASPFLDDNIAAYAGNASAVDKADAEWQATNVLHTINGKMWCGLEGFSAPQGSTIRWHLFGVGDSTGLHTALWSGHAVRYDGSWQTAVDVHPGGSATAEMVVAQEGMWQFDCAVRHHWLAGMRAEYKVTTPAN